MTKEEALRRVKGYLTDIIPAEDYSEVEEIMKALEQEPCEDVPDNDGDIYKCSCGYGWDKSKVFRHHFCPNCGKPVDGPTKTELKPCGDCISRKYLLDCVVDKVTMPYVPISKIENAPPVVSQPKMGRWILTPRDKYIDINCSVCGSTRIKDYSYGYSIDELNLDEADDFLSKARINYCEHCGTKMQGVKKDEVSE